MSSSRTDAAIVDVVVPQMGTSVAEGTVVAWSVDVGASVKADQVVCEISTDKIDSDVPAPASGTLAEIVVPVDATVDVGAVIGRIATPVDAAPASARVGGPRYSPVVRRVAAHHDVGALMATPVIPLPQVAILDLEAVVKRPVVIADADGADAIAIRSMMHLCMSWDHRALDGAYAAQFLTALRRRIEA